MIPIGGDQASYPLKTSIIKHLQDRNIEYFDVGNYDMEVTAYYIFVDRIYRFMIDNKVSRGILLCGSGLGASMIMNKYPGVRCGRCDSIAAVKLGRMEHDMNVLALGGRIVSGELADRMVDAFLDTDFDPAYEDNLKAIEMYYREMYKEEYLHIFYSGGRDV